jgi:uncharacterized RDD family membrane protein YckC
VTTPPPAPPPPTYPLGGYAAPPAGPYRPAPPPLSPGGQRLAEFGDRLVAWLIDALILGAAALVFIVPIYIAMIVTMFDTVEGTSTVDPYTGEFTSQPDMLPFLLIVTGGSLLILVIVIGLTYLYEVELMLRRGGQTFGKQAMKLKVIPLDPARRLDRTMAAKRFLIEHVAASFVPGLTYVDGLWQLWDKPYRQCLHDKFAETVVIKLDA